MGETRLPPRRESRSDSRLVAAVSSLAFPVHGSVGVPLTDSVVRQWLRDHPGVAYCARCIAETSRRASGEATIAAELLQLPRRSPSFLPGRCRCGAVGVRYRQPSPSGNH